MPTFIPDGYTFKAGINAEEGVHDGLEMTYRPMTPADIAEYMQQIDDADGKQSREITADWLAKKIIKFSMKDGSECPPVSSQVFLRHEKGKPCMQQDIYMAVLNIVIWGTKPDYGTETPEEAEKN